MNQNYPQGLTKGVCNTLYREAVMYVELCSLLATVHCQQPFYTGRLADEFSDTEFNIELYPNPTNKEFTLFTDNAEIIEFKIMDITGREIISNSFQTNTNISVVGWPSGIYLVYLKSENSGLVTTLKVMVE
ncbi:MAG: T9SS type A sorting domain-containing protein [Chitinophagales bacterium]|nr:T9SS type A sorting domain-containing protein [Saprospiraceae bacterium]MBK8683018.1 T9SS type A sorting domain-containing protein [Bacteroidota bacterium]MBP7400063.1 T9SS type A sorting domain-containing protein [Chitinophagales bacterium]MBP8755081.1 T9SS type A sorting domain-containing protein [Chitinophagales bacterium]MBP9190850.1 T9SS type A sorting domain-containing protein [Chitinophagales bacterium]